MKPIDLYNLSMASAALSKAVAQAAISSSSGEPISAFVVPLAEDARRKIDGVLFSLDGGAVEIPAELAELSRTTHKCFRHGDSISDSLIYDIVQSGEADRVWVELLKMIKALEPQREERQRRCSGDSCSRYLSRSIERLGDLTFKEKVLAALLCSINDEMMFPLI